MAIPQTQTVTANKGSIYLKEGVAHAAPTKNENDLTWNKICRRLRAFEKT